MTLREHTRLAPSIIELMVWMKLAVVGLADFGKLHPQELSGGMKKPAAVARAPTLSPEILVRIKGMKSCSRLHKRREQPSVPPSYFLLLRELTPKHARRKFQLVRTRRITRSVSRKSTFGDFCG